jgi:PAS domain S-box-containing protein
MTRGVIVDKKSGKLSRWEKMDTTTAKNKIVIFFIFTAIVSTLVGGVWFYQFQKGNLKQQAAEQLHAIVQLKTQEIANWRKERLGDASVITSNPLLSQAVVRWIESPTGSNQKQFEEIFQAYCGSYGYENVMIVNEDGGVVLSLVETEITFKDSPGLDVIKKAFQLKRPFLTPLHRHPGSSMTHISLMAPILVNSTDQSSPVVAVIILQLDAEKYLFSLIQSWPATSETAETLIVRKEGDFALFLNNVRHQEDASLALKVPLSRKDVPAVMAIEGTRGVVEGVDYREVPVLADIQEIPNSNWLMVSKVDRKEIYSEWMLRSVLIILLIVATLLALIFTADVVWQRNDKLRAERLLMAERALGVSEQGHLTTLLSVGDGVITTDARGCVQLLNPVAEELTGWSQKDAQGKPLSEVFHIINEYSREPVVNPVDKVVVEGKIVELANHTLLISKSGEERPIADSGAPIFAKDGVLDGVVLVFRDQTKERQAQNLLIESEEKYRELFENAPVGIFRTNSSGEVDLVNIRLANILGASSCEEAIAHFIDLGNQLYRDPNRRTEFLRLLKEKGFVNAFEYEAIRLDGEYCSLLMDARIEEYNEDETFVIGGFTTDITERVKISKALAENEKQLQATFNQAAVGIAHVAPDGKWLRVNQRLCDIVGYTQEEMLGKTFQDITHRDDLTSDLDYVGRMLSKQIDHYSMEKRYIKKNGEFVWANLTVSMVCKDTGEADYFVSIIEDISQRKKALAKLEESRLFAQGTLNALSANIAVINSEGTIVATNSAWQEFSVNNDGIPDRTNEGVNYLKVCEETSGEGMEKCSEITAGIKQILRGVADQYLNEYSCHCEEEKRWFQVRVTKFAEMVPPLLVVSHLNITDRKLAEEALRESEKRYRLLAENTIDCIWTMDLETHFTYINPSVKEMFGYTQEEWIGSKLGDHSNQENLELMLGYIRQELEKASMSSGVIFEAVMCHRNGSEIPVEIIGKVIFDKNNKPLGLQGVTRNITKRLDLESKLRQAQKMEAVGRLAGGIAHDFNNMLQTILGFTSLSMDLSEPGSIQSGHLLQVHDAANRSADLTRQLLAFARKQTIAPRILNLNETISGMLNMLSRLIGEDIELSWKPFLDIPPVLIDPSQLDQILANLVVNARDAISGDGEIIIETDVVEFDEEYCDEHNGFICGRFVMLSINDNGLGMDRETQDHIFDPFFTTKEKGKGTGLGLATIYGIMKQNTGFINVYSELEHGTIFKLYFPVYGDELPLFEPIVEEPVLQKGYETILFVEDEESLLNLGKMQLEHLGYHVLASTSPKKAIGMASDFSGYIHLLITDVVMPELSGRELWGELKEQDPTLKCLYMSGYTADIIANQGVLDEGVFFLQKPFTVQNLARKVREVIES